MTNLVMHFGNVTPETFLPLATDISLSTRGGQEEEHRPMSMARVHAMVSMARVVAMVAAVAAAMRSDGVCLWRGEENRAPVASCAALGSPCRGCCSRAVSSTPHAVSC